MSKKVKKKDFVAIEFVGRTLEDNKIFDLNVKDVAKKEGIDNENVKYEPLNLIVGEGFVVSGLDKALEGSEVGKNYNIELKAEEGFGKRNPKLIKVVNIKEFIKQKINPYVGQIISFEDGSSAKVLSINGGRVRLDFNHPLAGKKIKYEYKIVEIIEDPKKKAEIYITLVLGDNNFVDVSYDKSKDSLILKTEEFLKDYMDKIIERMKDLIKVKKIDIKFKKKDDKSNSEKQDSGKKKNKKKETKK